MDWFLSFTTVVTMFLLGRKNKWGWVVSAISSVLWIYYAISIHQYGLIPSSIILGGNAIVSGYQWFKADMKPVPVDPYKDEWKTWDYL